MILYQKTVLEVTRKFKTKNMSCTTFINMFCFDNAPLTGWPVLTNAPPPPPLGRKSSKMPDKMPGDIWWRHNLQRPKILSLKQFKIHGKPCDFLFFSEITWFRDFLFCFPNRATLYVILCLEGPLHFHYFSFCSRRFFFFFLPLLSFVFCLFVCLQAMKNLPIFNQWLKSPTTAWQCQHHIHHKSQRRHPLASLTPLLLWFRKTILTALQKPFHKIMFVFKTQIIFTWLDRIVRSMSCDQMQMKIPDFVEGRAI